MNLKLAAVYVFCVFMPAIACKPRPRPVSVHYHRICGHGYNRYTNYTHVSGIDLKVHSLEDSPPYINAEKSVITRPGGYVLSKLAAPFPLYYRYYFTGPDSRIVMTFNRKRYTSFSALYNVIHDTVIEIRDSSGIIHYRGSFRKPLNGLGPKGDFRIFGLMRAQPVKEQFYSPDGKLCQENLYNSMFRLRRTRYWNQSGKLIATETPDKLTFYFKDGRTEFIDTTVLGHRLHCKKKFDKQSRHVETAYYEGDREAYIWSFYDWSGWSVKEVVKSSLLKTVAAPEGLYEELPILYADESPEFPGGYGNFKRVLEDHLAGAFNTDAEFMGRYELIFTVGRDGRAAIDTIVKSPAFHANSAPYKSRVKTQVYNAINHQWKPGKVNGRPVKYYFKLSFRVDLETH